MEEIFTSHVLEEVGFCARTDPLVDILIAAVRREHDDPGVRFDGTDLLDCRYATRAGHLEIHERHIGTVLLPKFDRLLAVSRVGHHFHVRLLPDQGDDSIADDRMIFRHEHANQRLLPTLRALLRTGPPVCGATLAVLNHVHSSRPTFAPAGSDG